MYRGTSHHWAGREESANLRAATTVSAASSVGRQAVPPLRCGTDRRTPDLASGFVIADCRVVGTNALAVSTALMAAAAASGSRSCCGGDRAQVLVELGEKRDAGSGGSVDDRLFRHAVEVHDEHQRVAVRGDQDGLAVEVGDDGVVPERKHRSNDVGEALARGRISSGSFGQRERAICCTGRRRRWVAANVVRTSPSTNCSR